MMDEIICWIETGDDSESRSVVDIKHYPDGMPLITLEPGYVGRFLVRPRSLDSLMAFLFFVDAWQARGYRGASLVLPYFPGARQDRLNSAGDMLFTAKSVAQAINAREFRSVTVLDPHSDVVPALVDRCRVISAAGCINPPSGKYAAVIAPDAGAEKRAGAVARKLGIPLMHAWKTRDVATGSISGFGMEPRPDSVPSGSLVLVVDDICDGGGTFIGLADAIDAAGLRAHLWTTHGIFSNGTSELLKRFGHLYCTDSIEGPREGVIAVNVCENLLTKGYL